MEKQVYFTFWVLLLTFCRGYGQNLAVKVSEGSVSFLSSQHVYVKFASTADIEMGDTLFIDLAGKFTPGLVVKNKSTTSCVCERLEAGAGLLVGARIVSKKWAKVQKNSDQPKPTPLVSDNPDPTPGVFALPPKVQTNVTTSTKKVNDLRGRIQAASYSSFAESRVTHQLRYAYTLQGHLEPQSKWSIEQYLTFRHTLGEWNEVVNNLSNAIKFYSFALKYDIDSSSNIVLGRSMNRNLSSMGSMDGLQYEKNLGNFRFGGVLGFRPDFADYGFNAALLEGGAFVSHQLEKSKWKQECTLALVEQKNHGKTDRRFTYLQYSSSLSNLLHLFSSFELDLFSNINDQPRNVFQMTNALVSVQARFSPKFNLSAAYDNRRNVIYYESYRSFIDQLIEQQTRQGFRISANYRPFKFISWGMSSNWRFQKDVGTTSRNINSFLSFSNVPGIKAAISLNVNYLQTSYLNSFTAGIRLNKELIPGILNGDFFFRYVTYNYLSLENKSEQWNPGLDLSLSLTRQLSFGLYYEGTFDQQSLTFHRIHTRIIQRF